MPPTFLPLEDLKIGVEKKKKGEEKGMSIEEEKMQIEQNLADNVHEQKMKTETNKLKMKKINNMHMERKIVSIILLLLLPC
jgi:hypothetical protein